MNTTSTPTSAASATSTATPTASIALPAHPGALASSLPSLALPALVLLALGAAAILLGRRRRAVPRLVHVVEQTSLGPKRALVLARLGGEMLLLGSSEAGISLLKTQALGGGDAVPEGHPLATAQRQPAPVAAAVPPRPARGAVASIVARLAPVRRAALPDQAGFEDLLAESAEDQELRRKIAAGRAGSVR